MKEENHLTPSSLSLSEVAPFPGKLASWPCTSPARFRYTSDTVFDTFPWPQSPTLAQVKAVAEAAVSLRALRREIMAANGWSRRDLYRTLETPGSNRLRNAHAALDSAVRSAYGMSATEDTLAFLLAQNLELADQEAKGEPIRPPGLPVSAGEAVEFMSEDCITVREGERG